jgi:hypothetical protein
VAYSLLVERVERQYLADRTGLVVAAHMSGEQVTPPTLDEALEEFDANLAAVPEPVSDRDRRNQAFLKAV